MPCRCGRSREARTSATAELLRAYRDVLRPGVADDDAAALQDVLAVLSWVHRPGAEPVPRNPGLPSFGQHAAALAGGRFLRVINYHNTPAGSEEQLERELSAYLAAYDPVGVDDLDAFFDTGRWPTTFSVYATERPSSTPSRTLVRVAAATSSITRRARSCRPAGWAALLPITLSGTPAR